MELIFFLILMLLNNFWVAKVRLKNSGLSLEFICRRSIKIKDFKKLNALIAKLDARYLSVQVPFKK